MITLKPKNKAKELFDKFYGLAYGGASDRDYMRKRNALKLAVIQVDEMIDEHTFKNGISWNTTRIKYWSSVKSELKKLE